MQPFIRDNFLWTNQYAEKLYHDYVANYPKYFRRILCNVLGKQLSRCRCAGWIKSAMFLKPLTDAGRNGKFIDIAMDHFGRSEDVDHAALYGNRRCVTDRLRRSGEFLK